MKRWRANVRLVRWVAVGAASLFVGCQLQTGDPRSEREALKGSPDEAAVLRWLAQVQDATTPERQLLGSMEDQQLQTFNNALAAMAFVINGERGRAERILDFFSDATDPENSNPLRQNFFLRGEARGFFQYAERVELDGVAGYQGTPESDRWMGDMVWLLFAYRQYDHAFGSGRYSKVERLLNDLLVTWYTNAPNGHGGYVQHGWRKGDAKLHEDHGHHEGNIDAYAWFRMSGDADRAESIRNWLRAELDGRDHLPLDLYTWRALAFGSPDAALLDAVDHDPGYRKRFARDGREVAGVWHTFDPGITNNVWVDGIGHMACAFFAVGDTARGGEYTRELDALLMDRTVGGVACRSLPYTVGPEGGFGWVNPKKGFVSAAAWYLFAKRQFNPMALAGSSAGGR